MTTLTKHPDESKLYDMDFSDRLATGDRITEVVSVIAASMRGGSTLSVGATAFTDTIAQARLSGGAERDLYGIEFKVTTAQGNTLIGTGYLELVDSAFGDDSASTPLIELVDGVRYFAGDVFDPENIAARPALPEGAIMRGLRTVLRGGLVEGYALSADKEAITPGIEDDPKAYFLACAQTALGFLASRPDSMRIETRGFKSEVRGASRDAAAALRAMIYKAQAGAMCNGWSNFATYLEGISGIRGIWGHYTRLRIPLETFSTATLGSFSGQSLETR